MEVSGTRRLTAPEAAENATLKQLPGKILQSGLQRRAANWAMTEKSHNQRRATDPP
ncbi:hypothetical protein MACH17_33530 [Phaeobacter inhibens]|nr:hypothetical protein MACH17_33530 [Phaeobacter inhibens]